MTGHDPALRELDRRLADVGYLVADLAADLGSYLADVDVDPARLAWVQQRRADLAALTRKYGETVDDVLDWGRDGRPARPRLDGTGDRIGELEARGRELDAPSAPPRPHGLTAARTRRRPRSACASPTS